MSDVPQLSVVSCQVNDHATMAAISVSGYEQKGKFKDLRRSSLKFVVEKKDMHLEID